MHVCVAIVGYHSPLIYSYMALVIKRQYLGVSHDKLATISTQSVVQRYELPSVHSGSLCFMTQRALFDYLCADTI